MIPLYLDEDSMHGGVVRGLRAGNLDVLTAREAAMLGVADEEHLALAASQGRALFSCNVADFARLNQSWLSTGRNHAGIILLTDQGTPVGVRIRALTRLAVAFQPEEMRNRLEYLANWLERAPSV